MAKSRFPDALAMQGYKYGERSDEERDAMAEQLLDAGRRAEAVLLYEGRPEHPFLTEEAEWAAREGIAFHLLAIRGLGAPVSDDLVRRCAAAAEQRGRFMDARRCYLALGDDEGLARIAEHVPEPLRPAPPSADE